MKAILLGDSRDHVPADFNPKDEVIIIVFREPSVYRNSDPIILVSNGEKEGWIKPSNICSK
jgi:hypothetical protein